MIRLEDKEFENEILEGNSCIAMPIEIRLSADSELEIISYSFTENIAAEFEKRYSSDPFSDGAKRFLTEKLTPIMNELSYETEGASDRVHLEYRAEADNRTEIKPSDLAEIIDSLENERWADIPLEDFELNCDDIIDRMAVVRDNGTIVCFAALNDISEDDGYIEINVECDEKYRKKGYGSACVSSLANYLIGIGERVKYICEEKNTASQRTAERAGLTLHLKSLPFVCYKSEESEENQF